MEKINQERQDNKEIKKKKISLKTLIEKNPVEKCIIITLVAAVFIITGFFIKNPVIMIIGLIPAAFYEAYRTWGISTKIASVLLFLILVFELIILVFNINIDLAKIFGISKKYIAGYGEILIDIKVLLPLIIIFLSVILVARTIGIYTKWLSIILVTGCFSIIYILHPLQFNKLLNFGIKFFLQIINRW